MRGLARRRWLLSVFALGGLLLAVVSTSALALGESRGAAWCYDGNRWLGYAEGIPGSTAQEDFTACLRRSAERGGLTVLRGKLLEGGTLLDVGEGAIYWEYGDRESSLYVTAFDDRVVMFGRCGHGFQVQGGLSTAIASGGFCNGPATLRQSLEKVTDPDFTLFVVGRNFVADGEDGWYHVVLDRTGSSGNPIPRGELVLRNRGAAVWLSTEDDRATTGQVFSIRRQLAGDDAQTQLYHVSDWQFRVTAGLIPMSFEWAARDFLLPDSAAYWTVMKDFVDAAMDDLFRGRDERPLLDVVAHWSGLIHADRIVYHCPAADDWILMHPSPMFSQPPDEEPQCTEQSERTINTRRSGYFLKSKNVADLLERLAQHIIGTEVSSGGVFTATLLKLWERYAPDFSYVTALELADRYSVDVGVPIEVNPVSDRTTIAREVLSRMPPLLPSDYEPIDANELHLSLVLNLGQPYSTANGEDVKIAASDHMPTCSYLRGAFTVNPGGAWNGLRLSNFGGPREHGLYVTGTPAKPGRVRVRLELTNACPGAPSHRPQFVGYSEIIVVDPAAGAE